MWNNSRLIQIIVKRNPTDYDKDINGIKTKYKISDEFVEQLEAYLRQVRKTWK